MDVLWGIQGVLVKRKSTVLFWRQKKDESGGMELTSLNRLSSCHLGSATLKRFMTSVQGGLKLTQRIETELRSTIRRERSF